MSERPVPWRESSRAAPPAAPEARAGTPEPRTGIARRAAVATGAALATIALALLLWTARELFMLVFAGALLATIVAWPADVIAARTRIPRGAALALVLVGVCAAFALFVFLSGQRIATQVQELSRTLPQAFTDAAQQLDRFAAGRWVLEQTTGLRQQLAQQARSGSFLAGVRGVVSGTFGVFGNLVLVLLLMVFLAANPALYESGLVRLFPPGGRARVREIMGRARDTLRYWFLGQFASMTVVGVLTWAGLALLGVPLALTLGLLAGLLNFIPNFGPLIAAVPAVLLALAPHGDGAAVLDVRLALWVVLLSVGVQTLEGSLITPMIQRRAVDLAPALIVAFQVLLGLLVGPLGLVLATPFLALTVVVVRMAYIEDALGDRSG